MKELGPGEKMMADEICSSTDNQELDSMYMDAINWDIDCYFVKDTHSDSPRGSEKIGHNSQINSLFWICSKKKQFYYYY